MWLRTFVLVGTVIAATTHAHAKIVLKGDDEADTKAFDTMLEECAKHSKSFKAALKDWRERKDITVSIQVGHTGAYIDHAVDGGNSMVNIENFKALPEPDKDGKLPANVPPWALTRTELLMHVLREAFATAGAKFNAVPHEEGVHEQFHVREDFHQKNNKVLAQNLLKKDRDGVDGVHVELTLYSERLTFENGKLVIKYYRGRNMDHELYYEDGKWYQADDPKKTPVKFYVLADPVSPGTTFYASLGGALPFGDLSEGASESDEYTVAIPVEVGGHYRFAMGIGVGGYLGFGPAFVPDRSCPMASCSGWNLRVGATVDRYIPELGELPLAPWASFGVGYEFAHTTFETAAMDSSQTLRGIDFSLAVGGDREIADEISIGPYLRVDLAEYLHSSGPGYSIDIMQTALHGWISLGVRGTYAL